MAPRPSELRPRLWRALCADRATSPTVDHGLVQRFDESIERFTLDNRGPHQCSAERIGEFQACRQSELTQLEYLRWEAGGEGMQIRR